MGIYCHPLVQTTIISHMNLCWSLLTGLPASELSLWWSVLNTTARGMLLEREVKLCISSALHTLMVAHLIRGKSESSDTNEDWHDLLLAHGPLTSSSLSNLVLLDSHLLATWLILQNPCIFSSEPCACCSLRLELSALTYPHGSFPHFLQACLQHSPGIFF